MRTRVRRAKQLLEDILPTLGAAELDETPTDLDAWARGLRELLARDDG